MHAKFAYLPGMACKGRDGQLLGSRSPNTASNRSWRVIGICDSTQRTLLSAFIPTMVSPTTPAGSRSQTVPYSVLGGHLDHRYLANKDAKHSKRIGFGPGALLCLKPLKAVLYYSGARPCVEEIVHADMRRGLIAPRPDIDFDRTCRWTLPILTSAFITGSARSGLLVTPARSPYTRRVQRIAQGKIL